MTKRWRILLEITQTSAALHSACVYTIDQNTQNYRIQPEAAFHLSFKQEFQDASPLNAFLRDAARRKHQQAIEEQLQDFLDHHDHKRDEQVEMSI